MIGRQRDLGRSRQVQLVFLHAVGLVFRSRIIARPLHRLVAHQQRYGHGGVPPLDHEIDGKPQNRQVVARSGQLHPSFNVHHTQRQAQFDVIFGLEIELADFSFPPEFHVFGVVLTDRNAGVRRLGHL